MAGTPKRLPNDNDGCGLIRETGKRGLKTRFCHVPPGYMVVSMIGPSSLQRANFSNEPRDGDGISDLQQDSNYSTEYAIR